MDRTPKKYAQVLLHVICGWVPIDFICVHYNYVIMSVIVSQITSLTIVSSIAYSGTDGRKIQSSASLAIVREIHRN